ncbi:hypothetical protein [Sphaerotilus uruguayifluvii]|uniref:Uncharacterized protein n=1 Tax=Sphaerotilus uruguayifluvii TaxID=2735897 RepID=A0ABX2G5W8_9BURK|nr:hypothetical protein [Leptothrix sp. C29]NRT57723.1 hypothetical protein [Leptothrix sp. C29]
MKSTNTFLRHALALAAGAALMAGHVTGSAATTGICDPDGGYTVAYYNGTMALPDDADAQRAAMRRARHGVNTGAIETINGEVVHYETFYSANTAQLQALATTYRQSLDGALSAYWEYFWDFLGGDNSGWTALATKTGDSRFTALGSSFPAQVASQTAAALSEMKTAVPTSTTLGNVQKARVQALYTERQKVTLVSQGEQGALFADKGFASIGSPTDGTMLRLGLSARPGSDASALSAKMAALVTPTNLANNKGFFTATLSWSLPASAYGSRNDFDLHVIEPTPPVKSSSYVQWVHYLDENDPAKGGGGDSQVTNSLKGYAGYLDRDGKGFTADSTTEHYYASCDETKLLEGTYWIAVTKVSGVDPARTSITLQIATAKAGEVYSKTFAYDDILVFDRQTYLTFPVKIELKKNADGTWAKPVVTPYAPSASYDSTGLPTTKL